MEMWWKENISVGNIGGEIVKNRRATWPEVWNKHTLPSMDKLPEDFSWYNYYLATIKVVTYVFTNLIGVTLVFNTLILKSTII